MRRLNLVLLASLQLTRARQHAFSPFDDVLAHPQFEVVLSDTYIRETEALALVESVSQPNPTYAADFSQTDLTHSVRESTTADADDGQSVDADGRADPDSPQVSETFEIIRTPHVHYLCSVPVIAPPPALNQTATELAKAEEARELSRASAKGWELMRGLEGTCLYYMQGWWSYSFCYGKEAKKIVQFHALPGTKGGLPERDPQSDEYVLGTTETREPQSGRRQPKQQQPGGGQDNTPATEGAAADGSGTTAISQPPNTSLQVKGDQLYLTQRLEHGTICDLTGRPRTIDIQYHCNPQVAGDRIGWIKEVTTCTYLMLVQTPRLCKDVAFLPPKEMRAHPISCRQIVSSDQEIDEWRERKRIEAVESMAVSDAKKASLLDDANGAAEATDEVITIGGVVIGGRHILGAGQDEDGKPAAAKIKAPSTFAAAAAMAKSGFAPLLKAVQNKGESGDKGSETGEKVAQIVTIDDLEKLGLDPESVEQFRKELKKMAQDTGYFMVEQIDPEALAEGEGADSEGQDGNRQGGKKHPQNQGQRQSGKTTGSKEEEEEEGSHEEFFKEEL